MKPDGWDMNTVGFNTWGWVDVDVDGHCGDIETKLLGELTFDEGNAILGVLRFGDMKELG